MSMSLIECLFLRLYVCDETIHLLSVSDRKGSDNSLHHEAPTDNRNDGILSGGY